MAEYQQPLSSEDFLSQFDEEPEEYKQGLKQFMDQKGNRETVRVPFQDGNIVIKRNPSLRRKDDTPIVNYYFNNKEANIKTAENLALANEIFNLPATLSPLLTVAGAKMPSSVKNKAGVATSQILHRGGNLFRNVTESIVNKYKTAGTQTINVKGTKVTPSTSNVTGTTTAGNLQDKATALQTRISQFQAGASKSTRDLNLTTDYAKGSLLKDVSNEISLAKKAKVGKFSKYVDPKDTYYTPFGPYPLKTKPIDNVPKIQTDLNKLVLNKKTSRDTLYNALNTNTAQNLDSKHLKFTIDDIIDQGFAKQLGLRQGALSSVSGVLPGYIRRRDELAAIPKEIRSKGLSRDPHKGAEKNVKTNFRSLRDLSSLNLLTKHKDIFKIDRKAIKDALVTFKIGDKEWHHTFFGNKEGGKLFLNEVAQDPVVSINLMAKLQELNLPTSGVLENLALIEKYEDSTGIGHNKLHNIYRELGLEQGGDLDFAEVVDAVAESYLAGDKTAINHLFTLLEVYAERTAPFMAEQTKKAGGKMFKDTGVEQVPAVKKYSPKSEKFRSN